VAYYSTAPEVINVTTAVLKYEIVGRGIAGDLELWDGNPAISNFNLTIAALNLPNGAYTLRIFGNATNYNFVSETYILQVLAIPTSLGVLIDEEFRFSPAIMKGALGEEITFQINFTDDTLGYLGADASVTAFLEGVVSNNQLNVVYSGTNGLYNVAINVSSYIIDPNDPDDYLNLLGTYKIKIQGFKANYVSQSLFVDVTFLDYWNTELVIIEPPTFYPWGNNASFIVRYGVNELPRSGTAIPDADISQLRITYKIGNVEYERTLLDEDSKGTLWGWYDLKNSAYGPGNYLIWFDTSVVNVSARTAFYAIPTIQEGVNRNATARPYVWIAPVQTTLIATSSKDSGIANLQGETLRYYLDQSTVVTLDYSITDDESEIIGQKLNGAVVSYIIRNKANLADVLAQNIATGIGNGKYSFNLPAIKLGNWEVLMTSMLENHTTSTTGFTFIVDKKPIDVKTSENVKERAITLPQNHELRFSLDLKDLVNDVPLSGAIVVVNFLNKPYSFTENPSVPGRYDIVFSAEDLAALTVNEPVLLRIAIIKENYTLSSLDEFYEIVLTVTLPVDPYLGIPYMYWMIIGATVAIMIGALGISKAIQNARIPLVIKQIDSTVKLIKGNKAIETGRITLTVEEEIAERLAGDWRLLGLDLKGILGIQKKAGQDESLTPSDEAGEE
jgi:hypothetical protein